MTITHHPGEELLLAYASGASAEAVSLLVATHLALCPECRRTVAMLEHAGGAMLASIEPQPMATRALDLAMSRLDEPVPAPARASSSGDPLMPEPLRSRAESRFSGMWVPIGPGISYRPLICRGSVSARLLRGEPGSVVPTHTHRGMELTLVLSGALVDRTGRYERGDVQTTSPDITHTPRVDNGPLCYNLAVTDARLVFATPIPRLVGQIFGF